MCPWPGFMNHVWSRVTHLYQRLPNSLDAVWTVHESKCFQIYLAPYVFPCKITFFVTRDPGSVVATKSPGLVAPPSFLSLSMNRSVFTSIPWRSVSTCKPSRMDLGLQPDYACNSIRTPDGNNWSWGQIYLGPWFQRGQWSKFIIVAERKPLDGFLLHPLLFSLDPHEAIHIQGLSSLTDTPRDRPNWFL